MIILVGITVTVALNGGLFGTTQKAAYQTEVRTVQEQLEVEKVTKIAENDGNIPSDFGIIINDLSISDDLKSKYGSKLIVSKDGILYYDPAVVTDEEEQNWLEEIGVNAYSEEEIGVFEKYVLGETPGTKSLQSIMNMQDMTFIDEEGTIPDASTTVSFLNTAGSQDGAKGYIYAKYENVAYKIICDAKTYMTEGVEEIYTPQGKEGQDLGEVTGDSKYDGWTIIYDNGDGTIEAVSPKAMGSLRLGYSEGAADTMQRLEEAIASYNNAIDTINNYAKEQITDELATDENVRSVGAATDPRQNLEGNNAYRGIPAEWSTSTYNGRGKAGDTSYEQDLVRISYHEVVDGGTTYWIASRAISSNSNNFYFSVVVVDSDRNLGGNYLWYVRSSGGAYGYDYLWAVRPIIKVSGV